MYASYGQLHVQYNTHTSLQCHVYCGIIMSTVCVCVCMCVFRFMARKLYVFASGQCMAESSDSPMNQEILLGGHFYLMVLKVSLKNDLYAFVA